MNLRFIYSLNRNTLGKVINERRIMEKKKITRGNDTIILYKMVI